MLYLKIEWLIIQSTYQTYLVAAYYDNQHHRAEIEKLPSLLQYQKNYVNGKVSAYYSVAMTGLRLFDRFGFNLLGNRNISYPCSCNK